MWRRDRDLCLSIPIHKRDITTSSQLTSNDCWGANLHNIRKALKRVRQRGSGISLPSPPPSHHLQTSSTNKNQRASKNCRELHSMGYTNYLLMYLGFFGLKHGHWLDNEYPLIGCYWFITITGFLLLNGILYHSNLRKIQLLAHFSNVYVYTEG